MICGVESTAPRVEKNSFLGVIWGAAGSGKTVLASTAPAPILYINFDPNGAASMGNRDDVHLIDLAAQGYTVLAKFEVESDPGGLKKVFEANPEIQTVVVDSLTMISELALPAAVNSCKNSTLVEPGMHGYARRNMIVYSVVRNVLKICLQYNKNVIFVAHEQKPEKDEITGRIFQSILVGGELATLMTNRISEVWYLEDTGKTRRVTLRSNPNKRPMKTRMFDTSSGEAFDWKFDIKKPIDEQQSHTIRGWVNKWHTNGGNKISLP